MRKPLHLCLTLFVGLVLLMACNPYGPDHLEEEISFRNIDELPKDLVFINYLEDQRKLFQGDISLNPESINWRDRSMGLEDLETISTALGFHSRKELEKFLEGQTEKMEVLVEDYGLARFSEEKLEEILGKAIREVALPNEKISSRALSQGRGDCIDDWNDCRDAASTAALVGHALCVVSGGGLPCHSLVFIAHTANNLACDQAAMRCMFE